MTLWGGRFMDDPSKVLWAYTTDDSDRRLLHDDLSGSIAHVTMLGDVGILQSQEVDALLGGLDQIVDEANRDDFEFLETDEDIHSAVERRLGEIVGEVAGKLHTGRSRNDQISLDLRLYLSRSADERADELKVLASVLADVAEEHVSTVVPSFTHLQQAQPTSLGHHLLAYAWMALRDAARFSDARSRIDVSPLGAGASSGSGLDVDPSRTSELLGMAGVFDNSMDAVGSRDFVSEYVFCATQAMVHMSRLAEEIILWASVEFGWLSLGDEVSTGSSALPHKRNPDMAELIRGRAASVIGDLVSITTLQKGLPLTYNRDLQEDKAIVFHADDTVAGSVAAMVEMMRHARFDPPAPGSLTTSLDLAEALVRRGVPFRSAHEIVGQLIASVEASSRDLSEVTVDDLLTASDMFKSADLALVDPATSLASRVTPGSGNPESVRIQIKAIRDLTNPTE
jgi:argininosuccinate lyase